VFGFVRKIELVMKTMGIKRPSKEKIVINKEKKKVIGLRIPKVPPLLPWDDLKIDIC